ncbi:MAG: hypothetical protein ABWX90_01190 [Candidatus Saccharimonadales bacterium]
MLTPKDEDQRALNISALYNKPANIVTTHYSNNEVTFPGYQIWKLAFGLSLPIIIAHALITVYLSSEYNFSSDIQGASIGFIAAAIIIGLFLLVAIRSFRRNISSLLSNEVFLFWLMILCIAPLLLTLRLLFDFSPTNDQIQLLQNLGIYSVLLCIGVSLYIVMLTYVLERSEKTSRYFIAFILALVPAVLYGIIS